jgi:hypothetical protein
VGPTVTGFGGDRQLVLSTLAIADYGEGFDLDQNGSKDNKLAALGALANKQIVRSFTGKSAAHDIVIPFEVYGYSGADTPCPLAKDKKGNYRFPDGLSLALKFNAMPVQISRTIVPQ